MKIKLLGSIGSLTDLMINWLMGKVEYVDADTQKRQITICNQCKNLTWARMCNKCGCFVDLKTHLKHASCPLGYWYSDSTKVYLKCVQLNSYWYFFDGDTEFGAYTEECDCENALKFYKQKLIKE